MKKLFCSGIGDLIQMLSHCPVLPDSLLLATPRAAEIAEMCYMLGIKVETLEAFRTYYRKSDLEAQHGLIEEEDWSMYQSFPRIQKGEWKFERKLFANLSLPKRCDFKYCLVNPASMNKMGGRDLHTQELNYIMNWAKLPLVVVNKGDYKVPPHQRVLDLSNKTCMAETIALIRNASAYAGIDSFMAIAACQEGYPCLIKGTGENWWRFRDVYTAPNHKQITVKQWLCGQEPPKHQDHNPQSTVPLPQLKYPRLVKEASLVCPQTTKVNGGYAPAIPCPSLNGNKTVALEPVSALLQV